MPSSSGRGIATVLFLVALAVAPYAHAAETTAFGITNPLTGTLEFWSAILTSIESIAHELATTLIPNQPAALTNPPAPQQPPLASAASAALASEPLSQSGTTQNASATSDQTTQTPFVKQPVSAIPPSIAVSNQATPSPFVKSGQSSPSAISPAFQAASEFSAAPASSVTTNTFVTQSEFNAALSALGASVQQLLATSNPNPIPEYIAGNGNPQAISAGAAIDNLSNVTITNPSITGLSASDIPDLSRSYLSLGGGTLTGAFADSSNAPSSFAGSLGIGTTSPSDVLAVNGPIYLANITPAATTNRLYSNAGSLYWAGSVIAGASTGNWTTDGTNVWRTGGDVGIGTSTFTVATTSNVAALSVNGSLYLSGQRSGLLFSRR
jgi:hypothetical protein